MRSRFCVPAALLALTIIIISVSLVVYASYLLTAPSSVPVTVNPPGDWTWGPGWNP
jgi:hypothetical protein